MEENEIYVPNEIEVIFNNPIDTSLQGGEIDLEQTNTYKWSGAELTQQVGLVIPVVYGKHVMAGNLVNVYIEEGENETLNMLIAVCEGEIESISNVKINGNPIENFYSNNPADPYGKSAEVSVRTGISTQTPIEGFGDLHSYTAVNHILTQGNEYIYEGVVADAEGFSLEVTVDELYQLDDDGNMLSWYVSFQVDYKLHTSSTWIFMGVYDLNKKTTSEFKRYIKSEYVAPGKYDIRIKKVSEDDDDVHKFGSLTLVSVDEITTENLAYPSTAMMGLRLLALQNLQTKVPNVTCLVTGRKVRTPKVTYSPGGDDLVDWDDYYFDPNEGSTGRFKTIWNDAVVYWDEQTYVEAWSGNPVWCLWDLLLAEGYGLGDKISESQLDESSFLASALYCEEGVLNEENKKEKRFRLDLVLDNDFRANDVVSLILRSFRGLIDTSRGAVRVSVERQADPVFLFTVGNILKDSLTISYLNKKVVNVISSDFTNKDKNYARDKIEIGDEDSIGRGENIRQESYQSIGCTRVSQIVREAKILLNKLKYNRVMIAFAAYIDAYLIQPNDIFSFQHEMPAWGEGGRVDSGSTASLVKLDKEITIEANQSYEIMVKNGLDDTVETRTVDEYPGTYSEVNVTSPFTFTPQEYDVWALGVVEQSIQEYRALTVSKSKDGRVDIQAIQYTAGIYDDTGVVIPKDEYIHLSLDIPSVTGLTLKEKNTRHPDGSISSQVEVSYKKPITASKWIKQATQFEVHTSDDDGRSWNLVGVTDKEYYVIPDSFGNRASLRVAVVSIAEDGSKNLPSTSPSQTILIQGWSNSPSNITGFTYTFTDEIRFTWDAVTDDDLAGYEVRFGDFGWGQNDDYLLYRGKSQHATYLRPYARSGVKFYVRAFNTSGVYSDQSAYLEPVNDPPASTELRVTQLFQKGFLSWDDIRDADLQHYEVWRNSEEGFSGDEQENEVLVGKIQGTSHVVEVPHDPTFFRIRGFDRFSGGEWSNVVSVGQVNIATADVGIDVIRGEHILAGTISGDKLAVNSITADKIAANSITAEHLAIDTLSALSADIGHVIAGTLVGTLIKTSDDDYRIEIDQTGLYSYDEDGKLVVKLTQGELCLIDPSCNECYTFFDAGQMKWHTPYGDIPHLKRIDSGVVTAGSSVYLCQWADSPHIIVGMKRLTSYDSAFTASCQEWCVYHDNVRQWDNGGGDFGWAFDVHAKLALSGGTEPECILDVPFNTVCCTGACICQTVIRSEFQIWCNNEAPSNYYYGQACYEVKYREAGCGVWCSCCYSYEHPHDDACIVETDNRVCQTVQLGAGSTYEIELNMINVSYRYSTVKAGSYECCECKYQYAIDCSYWLCCVAYNSININRQIAVANRRCVSNSVSGSWSDYLSFGSWTHGLVCQSNLYYTVSGSIGGSIQGEFGGGGSGDVDSVTHYESSGYVNSVNFYSSMGASIGPGGFDVVITYPGLRIVCHCYIPRTTYAREAIYVSACQEICYKCCLVRYFWCCYCYKVWEGVAKTCCYSRWYSMTEISGEECILDPSGEVNYFAVAYA